MSSVRPARRTHVVGAASIWVLGQVAGPRRSARVLHAGDDAVYLDLEGSCLGVLGARAVQVPCGVRTTMAELPPVQPDDEAGVHDGSVELPGLEVLVAQIVDTTVPVVPPDMAAWGREYLESLVGDRVGPARAELPADALRLLADGDPAAVVELLGRGTGLTPVGDDVLAGWLATAVAHRHPGLEALRAAVALSACERTTTLSASLLACAARGEAVPELRSLLCGVNAGSPDVVAQSLDLLLRIGESSGQGLVLGALLALEAAAERA